VEIMKRAAFVLLILILLGMPPSSGRADDTELFIVKMPPDALILLDMSGSMNWDPSGDPASYPDRRIDIAKNVLFDLLDDDNDNKIDKTDERSLNTRLGYMRFREARDNDDGEPMTGAIQVLSPMESSYSDIWDKINDPEETAIGWSPLAASLHEAKIYFTRDVNPNDPAIACRDKYVILITDGVDTLACGGNGGDDESINPGMHKRRISTVLRAKELQEAGIKVFTVGLGAAMPEPLRNTLNWIARYGGTDNSLEANRGDPKAFDLADYGDPCTVDAQADPASYPLSGYAFLAQDAVELSQALKTILGEIQETTHTFTVPTVPSIRLVDQDTLYIASFTPNTTPFWRGSLKAYRLDEDGSVPLDGNGNPVNPIWESFEPAPAFRRIYTNPGSTLLSFTFGNLTNEDLDVPTDADRERLINHIRGIDAYDVNQDGDVTQVREWMLGDIFHSNPVAVGAPSPSFEDTGFNGTEGFSERNRNRAKVILVGANDGMLHAYNASTGREEWGYVPGSLLTRLSRMASAHTYYVDSSPKVSDVWFYQSSDDRTKSADEWRTVLVCGLRKGGKGYFALDITDTLAPVFLWEFPRPEDTTTAAKLGQSWSEPAIGRVKIEIGNNLVERWVAFLGGGFDENEQGGEANVGRAFFVLDIKTGEIIWEYSYTKNEGENDRMRHSLAAPPKAVDLNFDGYTDRVYVGDLGGQMWVFDVSFDGASLKSNSRWNGKRLFSSPHVAPEKHPIFYQPAVALDPSGTPWVFFGTGDRENPTEKNSQERFYAVKNDDQGPSPYEESNLSDVTSENTFNLDPTAKGWFIRLARGEKVLARPAVFNRLVYFTTYLPTSPDPCEVSGEGKLYTVEYLSGGGATYFSDLAYGEGRTSDRSVVVGPGLASAPVITVSTTRVASVIIGTASGRIRSEVRSILPRHHEILYWREIVR
jgi:Tfp pilus tip-associated adhesin PilY1